MSLTGRTTKTVLELDLVSYSDIARVLEENLDVHAVKVFQDQIQSFVDEGLLLLGLHRDDVVFGTAGDNALLFFDDAATAHRFAEAVQRASADHNRMKSVESAKRWFRIGAATGVVLLLVAERRIVGTTVTRAVRLEAAARKGQLVVDTQTFDALPGELQSYYGVEEVVSGKGVERYSARRCTFIEGVAEPEVPRDVERGIQSRTTAEPLPTSHEEADPAVARRAYTDAVTDWAASWRLFDSHRDIRIADIYVQEVLRETAGGLFVTAARSPPVPEADVLADICGDTKRKDRYSQVWSISGEAGVGKSTLLRQWAVILGRAAADPATIGRRPLFVPLRHLSRELKADGRITLANLATASRAAVPEVTEAAARAAFEDVSAAVFLLDGLDEMDEAVRPLLVEWLAVLPSKARAVVSLRPQIAVELYGLPRTVGYRVCDFSPSQIDQFVRQWFREDLPLGKGFATALAASPRVREVAAIPLLLTGLCLDAETAGACEFTTNDNSRAVYRRVVAILLAEWDAGKTHRRADPALVAFGLTVFAGLAVRFPFDASFGLPDLRAEADRHAPRFGAGPAAVDELIRRATATGRLLVVEPTYGFAFAHRAFHDFFFAEGVLALNV